MITLDTPLALLLAIPLGALTYGFWRNGFVNLSQKRARIALAVRIGLLAVIILGLAGLSIDLGQNRQASVLVADLSASDAQKESQVQTFINSAAEDRPGNGLLGVVDVGRDARVEQPVTTMSTFDGFQTEVDRDYTDLSGGLLLANAILPSGYQHRVTLMSDGQENLGDALSAASLLHSLGVRVDVWPIHMSAGPEVLVDSVSMPSQLRPKEQFSVTVAVRLTVSTTMQLTVYRDQSLAVAHREVVHVGENAFSFNQPPLSPGFHTYQVNIDPQVDTDSENNAGSAFTLVSGPPKVLVISPVASQAADVLASLRTTGIRATLETPGAIIPSLSYLQQFAAVVLIDTPEYSLDPTVVSDLVPYVRDLGHGLVVIGGDETYGMGGYGHTGLEQVLPVNMNLPKRRDLPSAAVVLIIEDLESNTQVDISKEAGIGVVNLLTQQDQIAVDDAYGYPFPVPLQYAVNKPAIDHEIDNMQPNDPISYAPDLQDAYQTLRNAKASVKHIILLGDGDATDPTYEQLAKKIRAGGVTISTVATNGMGWSDDQTMEQIAKWGGGHYYNANNPSAIPSIFLREARTVARSGIIEGKFYPIELSANPMIRDLHGVTDLTGYVATTPKPTGEMVLVSKKLDPVLAGWQFGLGRSVAWTSDASGMWTRDWLRAPGANKFWADLVDWTLPAANGGQLSVNTSTSQGQGNISVHVPQSLGPNATVSAHILGPNLGTSTVQLQPTAPGQYQGSFPANSAGAYYVSAVGHGNGHAQVGTAGLDIPYSAEYRTTGTNMAYLRSVAQAGGGSIVSSPSSVWAANLSSVSARQSLSLWLWLLALLLLPIDVGVRRLIVSRQDLRDILRAVPGFRQPVPALVPAVATLGTIRETRAGSFASVLSSQRTRQAEQTTTPGAPTSGQAAGKSVIRVKTPPRTKTEKPAPFSKEAPAKPDSSTTSSLLAAKRKRS